MKTIKEFRERLVMGTVITTRHYIRDGNGQMTLNRTFAGRVVIGSDRHAFRIRTDTGTDAYPRYNTNWMHWPMREFFKPIDDRSVAIETDAVRIEIIITGSVLSS